MVSPLSLKAFYLQFDVRHSDSLLVTVWVATASRLVFGILGALQSLYQVREECAGAIPVNFDSTR